MWTSLLSHSCITSNWLLHSIFVNPVNPVISRLPGWLSVLPQFRGSCPGSW